MTVVTIECTASRTFNHPVERFANFRFSIQLAAELDFADQADPVAAVRKLRQQAENIAEGHKQEILEEIQLQSKRRRLQQDIEFAEKAPDLIAKLQAILAGVNESETPEWQIKDLQSNLEHARLNLEELPKLRALLASIPAPVLLPEPEIHPGHPGHPDTNSGDDDPR